MQQLTIHYWYHHPFKDQFEGITEGLDLWGGVSFSQLLRLLLLVPVANVENTALT